MYRIIGRLLTALFWLSCAITAFAYYKLPKPSEIRNINPALMSQPRQQEIEVRPFKFPYGGRTYVIEPVADYEIAGLIVSHNDTTSITDAYHDSDSVDLKDLCLVWGKNASQRVLKDLAFRSEPWTCFVEPKNEQGEIAFRPAELSNNHLVGSTPEVREKIREVSIGDQVLLEGKLINYYDEKFPDAVRNTSLVRTDTGNGACEVLYVDRITILSKAAPRMRSLYENGKLMVILLAILRVIAFFIFPYLEFRSGT